MRLADLEDIYELTPMQQGMMFHTLLAPESGQYFEQLVCDLEGRLDAEAFRRAWEAAVRNHSIFRTSFVTDGSGKPVQVVHREVALPFELADWRSLTAKEQESREAAFLRADRERGFELAQAPLMRLSLFRLDENLHRFIWSRHHLLTDAWSRGLVFDEVFTAYEAFRAGRDFHPPARRPYGDYIAWLQEQDLAKAERYWRKLFQGFEGSGALDAGPAPDPGRVPEDVYFQESLRIPAPETAKLRAFARQQNLTFNTFVQGAWALLLGRYSDRDDVVFGATVAGRPPDLEGVESMIGLFVNTLPVRVRMRSDAVVSDWLKELQSQQAELREYEYSPLVEIQRWSGIPPGRPLFDTLVVFENAPRTDAGGKTARSLRVRNTKGYGSRTNYPLSLLVDAGTEIELLAVADSRLYEREVIHRLLGHLRTLMEAMASRPDIRLEEVPLLTSAEQRQLLLEWNETATEYPRNHTVHRMFEAQAAKTPGRRALFFGNSQWSFRELNSRANQLAHFLEGRGIGRGDLVGICVERSPEMVCALLAVLKTGAAYLPLDPAYPKERLAFILRDSAARIAIVGDGSGDRLPAGVTELVSLGVEAERIARQPDDDLGTRAAADDIMYVAYTSGSTGTPKGVEAVHRASINRFAWMWERYPFSPDDVGCLTTSLSFLDSVWQIFGPLLQGVPIRIIPDHIVREPRALVESLELGKVTRLVVVPSLLRAILEAVGGSTRLKGLRQCVSSGEALPVDLARDFLERLPSTRLINLYGSSEVAADVTVYEVGEAKPPSIPIGRPIANTQIYILDSHLRPVPIGVVGGLYVGGDGVALGYRGRPELTRERFLVDHFRDRQGARLYWTGDVARYRPDGVIEYLGRSDHQVKIRGYRVEPAEVESTLAEHPAVRASAVTARKDPAGSRLVAYVLFRAEPAASGELREFLFARLPEYMVPSLFVPVAEFPLTPNGKIDRAALPEPELELGASRETAEAPRSEMEELLASIWMEVLQLRRVGIRENFFELGGHSLLATRVASRIRDAFGIDLPLRVLFESPTIVALTERIESAQRAADGIETAPIRPTARSESYPLSFAQQRLWFVQQLDPDAAHYNVQKTIRMSGELDEGSLERALTEIVRRHESLRTTFGSSDGGAFQKIRERAAASLRIDRLNAGISEDEQQAELMTRATEDRRRPFDLSQDPLLRARLIRLQEQDHVLILTLHHIVCDAWSLGLLERELSVLYGAFSAGRPSPLPDLPIQYPDYAVWQRQFLTGDTLERLLSYWRGILGNESSDITLSRRQRPAVQSFRGARHSQRLSPELIEPLRAISREENATLFMLLLAAFQALLSRETGRTDIRVGTDIANRSRIETENLIGFFVNLLVLRADLSGNPRFRELLGRVREAALGAYAHQDLPFERLVEELKPQRDLSRNPLVQILFVMQNVQRSSVPPPGLAWSGVDGGTDVARFDLAVFVNDTDGGLVANWVYNTDLFDATEIRGMAERFQNLLEDVGKRPETRLENLAMVNEDEREKLAQEKSERREAQSARLRSMRRKGIDLSQIREVKFGSLAAGQTLPLVVEPEEESLDLAEWGRKESGFLGTSLLKHGAILFRGFGVKSAEEFERFASGLCPELFGEYGDLPRESVGGRVYGSTPYPSDQPILFHNESAHMHRWPMKIWFYCVLPSRSGGETPIVDCRAIYERLDPALRKRFADKGLLYVRNYTEGLDVSWQSFYGTDDRRRVEEACERSGTEWEWTKGNGLRTRQRCPAIIRHPQTGEMSFFNQLQLHHVSFLEPAVRESLSAMMREEDLPRNVYYGDGSRIEDSVMQDLLALYRSTAVEFPWQAGDVLMLNNMLVAHSRNPYVGSRKIVVAMGEMVNQSELSI